jgi:hypothetical protein
MPKVFFITELGIHSDALVPYDHEDVIDTVLLAVVHTSLYARFRIEHVTCHIGDPRAREIEEVVVDDHHLLTSLHCRLSMNLMIPHN